MKPPSQAPQPSHENIKLIQSLALHEENTLNQRINIFLVVQSLMLVTFSQLQSEEDLLKILVSFVGVFLSFVWCLVNIRQLKDLQCASKALREAWPDVVDIFKTVPAGLKSVSLNLMVYGLPLTFALLWVVLWVSQYTELV